jgi:hypothetical protein
MRAKQIESLKQELNRIAETVIALRKIHHDNPVGGLYPPDDEQGQGVDDAVRRTIKHLETMIEVYEATIDDEENF